VACISGSRPTLCRKPSRYQRHFALTEAGVAVTETSTDTRLARAIREHALEVTGFVRDGMPALMRGTMRG
jgi:hypothetical protein